MSYQGLVMASALMSKLLLIVLLPVSCRAVALHKHIRYHYSMRNCSKQSSAFDALVQEMLSPYSQGITAEQLFAAATSPCYSIRTPEGTAALTTLVVVDGRVYAHSLALSGEVNTKAFTYYYIPLMQKLAASTTLPDMLLVFNPDDSPTDDNICGGPAFGYCNVRGTSTNLLLPASCYDPVHPNGVSCSANYSCSPGADDSRLPTAAFLGHPTGWLKGKRRSVLVAGQKHPELVYSGVHTIPQEEELLIASERVNSSDKVLMSMQEQTETFKYFVSADGQCAAMRLKTELFSASAVFVLQSDEVEWYSPLLKPYKHFVPVLYNQDVFRSEGGSNLASKVVWAEEHPDQIKDIVESANVLANLYLTEQAQICFATKLLHDYAQMITNPKQLRIWLSQRPDFEVIA